MYVSSFLPSVPNHVVHCYSVLCLTGVSFVIVLLISFQCFGEWEKVLKMVRSVNSTDSVGLSRDITNSDSFSNLEELRLPSP